MSRSGNLNPSRWGTAACAALAAAWCCTAGAQEPLTPRQQDIEKAGTVLKYAIPASALLATWVLEPRSEAGHEDGKPHWLLMGGSPRHDLFLALGRTVVVTKALKYTVDETRPNGEPHSFPSGHTSMAFTGAEFIRKQYGWGWGTPAYLAAGFVGWSRVETDHHYWRDVVAGAAIGILANHDFWQRQTAAGRLSFGAGFIPAAGQPVAGIQFRLVTR